MAKKGLGREMAGASWLKKAWAITPNFRNVPVTPTPSIFPKVLPYKWGAYCSTNGRRIAGFLFLRSLEARKVQRYKWGRTAVQIGGVLPYFLDKL